ncbi:unnamed protein product [Calypogeia fissa]
MESLRSSAVCSSSFKSSAIPIHVGPATIDSSNRVTAAPGRQSLHWNGPRSERLASLSTSNTVQFSSHSFVKTKLFHKLQKSHPPYKLVGNGRRFVSALTKDESTKDGTAVDEITSGTLPEQALLSQHPWDPHKPNFSKLLPESVRPYPSFEGWFVRLWDPATNFSAAVILATNYATGESQVTLLFTPTREDLETRDADAVRSEVDREYVLRTYAVAEMSKEAAFVDVPSENVSDDHKPLSLEPVGFEWKAPGLGMIKTTADVTEIDVTIMGYSLQARLSENVLWDADQSESGPEGWARNLPVPTHWYVYSLGSKAEFKFSGPDGVLAREGRGWAHQEKNWGLTFPSGHVWFQGFTSDNSAQILGSAAYYKIGESARTPYLITFGYRSPEIAIDMRTNQFGTIFKKISISPLTGEFSVEGVSASHTVYITARGDPQSLSEPILAPIGKTHWETACRETYLAEIDVEVYKHSIWGIAGNDKLVDKKTFKFAGLEFGEDLLKEAAEKAGHMEEDAQIERSRALDS